MNEKKDFIHLLQEEGIRFEIGNPNMLSTSSHYMEQVDERSVAIFYELFKEDEDIKIMIHDYHKRKIRSTGVIKKFIKNKKIKYTSKVRKVNGIESYFEINIRCRVNEIKIKQLLHHIASKDIIGAPNSDLDYFIIGVTNKQIYHLYDDRGLDIFLPSESRRADIKNKYQTWVLSE